MGWHAVKVNQLVNSCIHTLSRGISTLWNANSLAPDLNTGSWIYFQRLEPLYHEYLPLCRKRLLSMNTSMKSRSDNEFAIHYSLYKDIGNQVFLRLAYPDKKQRYFQNVLSTSTSMTTLVIWRQRRFEFYTIMRSDQIESNYS